MDDIARRLLELRKRARLNQTEFAAIAGVSRNAQVNYEAGKRSPDSSYLNSLARAGYDVPYLLTGKHTDVNKGVAETAARYDDSGPWARNLLVIYGLSKDDAMCEPLRGVDTAADGSPRVRNALASVVEVYSRRTRESRARKLGESIEKLQSPIKPTAL